MSTIATAGLDGKVKLWNSEGDLVETLAGHSSNVNGVSFSPNGKFLISGSEDRSTRLWQINDLDLTILIADKNKVYNSAISPDKSSLITAGENGIKLWRNGKLVKLWRKK